MNRLCCNTAVITHTDPAVLQWEFETINGDCFFDSFVPMPEKLKNALKILEGKEPHDDNRSQLFRSVIKEFNCIDEADWQVNNWGCRRIDTRAISLADGKIRWVFDSKWLPPIKAYNKLVKTGFEIAAYYFDPGLMECGLYQNGNTEEYLIESTCSNWITENIPEVIVEEFKLTEFFKENED